MASDAMTPEMPATVRFGVSFGLFGGVLLLAYGAAYLAFKVFGFDSGTAIYDVGPVLGALTVRWKLAQSYRAVVDKTDYWVLVMGCLLIETGIAMFLISQLNPRVFGMYLSVLPVRLVLHPLIFMYWYSDKSISQIARKTSVPSTEISGSKP